MRGVKADSCVLNHVFNGKTIGDTTSNLSFVYSKTRYLNTGQKPRTNYGLEVQRREKVLSIIFQVIPLRFHAGSQNKNCEKKHFFFETFFSVLLNMHSFSVPSRFPTFSNLPSPAVASVGVCWLYNLVSDELLSFIHI